MFPMAPASSLRASAKALFIAGAAPTGGKGSQCDQKCLAMLKLLGFNISGKGLSVGNTNWIYLWIFGYISFL